MVAIDQAVLVLPIVAALTRQIVEDLWEEYGDQLRSLGSTPFGSIGTLLWEGRITLLVLGAPQCLSRRQGQDRFA